MNHHRVLLFLVLVTTCSADSLDECCKAKIVGDISYTLSRVITDNDSNFDQAADCINKCVYKETESGNEFCFKSGDLMVECNRMSDATMKNNSHMVAESAKTSIKKLTAQFNKLDNFTTVQDKFEWAQMYMPDMPVTYNSSMDMFDAMVGKHRMEAPLAKKARTFITDVSRDLAAAGENFASIDEVLDRRLDQLSSIPDEDNTVIEFQTYGLEAGKAMLKFINLKSESGEGGAELYVNSLVANTNSSDITLDILMRKRGLLDWVVDVVVGTVAGAVSGCVAGALATAGPGCVPGAVVGAAAGAAGGVVVATANEIKRDTNAMSVGGGSGCFSGDSMIETLLGLKMISELRIGDKVRTSRHDTSLFTEVNILESKFAQTRVATELAVVAKSFPFYCILE